MSSQHLSTIRDRWVSLEIGLPLLTFVFSTSKMTNSFWMLPLIPMFDEVLVSCHMIQYCVVSPNDNIHDYCCFHLKPLCICTYIYIHIYIYIHNLNLYVIINHNVDYEATPHGFNQHVTDVTITMIITSVT